MIIIKKIYFWFWNHYGYRQIPKFSYWNQIRSEEAELHIYLALIHLTIQ